jgi:glycosyltransferase involved in cell wall biosynthesis
VSGDGQKHCLILRQSEPYPYGWVRQEAQALAEAGFEVTVVCPTGLGHEVLDETIDGVRAMRYKSPSGGTNVFGYVREFVTAMARMGAIVLRLRRRSRVDAVIVSTPPDFLMLFALPFRRKGAGIVFDQRDPGPELFEAKFGRRGPIYRALVAVERFAFRSADVSMPHNESCADIARERGGVEDDRIFTVGVGPDPRRIFPVPSRPELRRGRRHLVLWIGSMSKQESLGHLIEAADQIVHRHGRTDVAFSIVGPGDERESIQAEVRRRALDDVVDLPGLLTDDDLLRAYMATADVCLSVDERNEMNDKSTMMKVLEYMAMGRPIVQFPLIEMERICGDTTIYAQNADPSDLADKVVELLDDPDRRAALGEAARRRVLDGQMWPDQIPVLVAAVNAAIERRQYGHHSPPTAGET